MRDPNSKWHLPTDRYPSTRFPPYAEGPLYVVSQVRRERELRWWGWGLSGPVLFDGCWRRSIDGLIFLTPNVTKQPLAASLPYTMERHPGGGGTDDAASEAEVEEVPSTYFEAMAALEEQGEHQQGAALFRFEDVFVGALLVSLCVCVFVA